MTVITRPGFERKLARTIRGDILVDPFSKGRYATDASIYQMMPAGVVIPHDIHDVEATLAIAREEGLPILARGGGTSQCGQTVNEALVIDNSRHFNKILDLDVEGRRCLVEPGIVLDALNRALKPHGLWYPIDVSTSSRATIGGMAGNNSCGGKSLRYGTMRDNVLSIDAIMADGTKAHFGAISSGEADHHPTGPLVTDMLALGEREALEIAERFPKVMRRVGGYNIDALVPSNEKINLSHLLVGSEGTLAYSTAIELKLSPLILDKVLGVCHFASFHAAMEATQHLVKLKPQGIELVDATMIALARDIPLFKKTMGEFVEGTPEALLLVEFAEDDPSSNLPRLAALEELMGDLGFSWQGTGQGTGKNWGGVVKVIDPRLQGAIAEVRKSGLNIMMSMKSAGKPVSFVEDCAVELPDLAAYTAGLTDIFEKHGTRGTWYAHASVGCLHVRPILNLKLDRDVATMRAIAEECFDLVATYKGSHSGEHGDGIVRSEFHEKMFGLRMIKAFGEVKTAFDPTGFFNPGKIVNPPKMDDRTLFRYHHTYQANTGDTALDWSKWPGQFQGAVEACNNNGACRKLSGGTMCPSYRVTRNERDVTRGRANTLRLALSGQLGPDALSSNAMAETVALCVSCKACKRECPTGVDMARMKIEILAARAKKNGSTLHERLIAHLPAYAGWASRMPWLMNMRNTVPALARLLERPTGFSANRSLPRWRADPFRDNEVANVENADVVLFADIFNRYFEPENLRACLHVLKAGGIKADIVRTTKGPALNCGRTYLAVGLMDEAKREAGRLVEALWPHIQAGRPVIGLEPSSLLTLRDEIPVLLPGEKTEKIARHALMLEEFLAQCIDEDTITLPLRPLDRPIMLHGHCHQKAFNIVSAVEKTLHLIPDARVQTLDTSCCGMAGSFGYAVKTETISRQMAELDLFPAIRKAEENVIIVANGTSCRHQIEDGTGKKALHVARVLEMALK